MTQHGDGLQMDAVDRPGPPPELREPPRRSRALGVFAATFALAAFAGVVWYAYDRGLQAGSETTAPLIQADPSPIKVRPDRPGGLDVPNQDKLVFEAMRPGDSDSQTVERLLPLPETPAEPPSPPPTAETATETTGDDVPIPTRTPQPASTPDDTASAQPQASTPQATEPEPAAVSPAPVPPAPAPQVASAPSSASLAPAETDDNAAADPAPPQSATALAGRFRVQLAAVRDAAVAEREWTRLQNRYPDLLSGLTLRVQRIDLGADKGVFHRIQGGMLGETEADRLCEQLKAQNQPCILVRP